MTLIYAAETLKQGCSILSQLDDLSPANDMVNEVLGVMVKMACKWQACGYGKCLLAQEDLQPVRGTLPRLCARAEGEMERHWARQFIAEGTLTEQNLRRFWYYDNYLNVVETELAMIRQNLGEITGLSFVGAGPLPMTVLLAAFRAPEMTFDCVDCDEEACALAEQLVAALDLADRIRIIAARGETYLPPAGYLPLVASLVDDKPALYRVYAEAGIDAFMVRDAEDIYQFIYHPAEQPDADYWQEAAKTPLCTSRLNTTRLYCKGPKQDEQTRAA